MKEQSFAFTLTVGWILLIIKNMNFLLFIAGFLFPGITFLLKKEYFRGIWFMFFTSLPFILGVMLLQSVNPESPGVFNWFKGLLQTPIDASGAISFVILNILRLLFVLYPVIVTPGLFLLGILIDQLGLSPFNIVGVHYREIATCFCISSALLNILVLLNAYDHIREKE